MVCMANEEEKIAHQFLESFLNLVTVPSFSKCDMLARTGIYSIHALLLQIVPEVKTAGADEILLVPEPSLTCRNFECLQKAIRKGTCNMIFCVELKMIRIFGSIWMSQKKFNRYLETIGFQRIRVRMLSIVRYRDYLH